MKSVFFVNFVVYVPIFYLELEIDMIWKETLKRRFMGLSVFQIAILVILSAMLFLFSDSSLLKRMKYENEIRDLKTQIEYYREQTETDKVKLHELQSSSENLEKFARENYLMKRENEEVFIIEWLPRKQASINLISIKLIQSMHMSAFRLFDG